MNLANKITITRIILAVILLILLLIPFEAFNISFPTYLVGNTMINLKYIIAGVIFLVASVSDFLDGYIARSRNMVTDFGKVTDAIADKILVNGVLIILAYERFIPVVIPVVIITRDIIVDTCKMISGNKGKVVAASVAGKIKTVCMMVGLTLTFFYNIPFEFLNFDFSTLMLIIATIMSIISGCQYFYNTKKYFINDK